MELEIYLFFNDLINEIVEFREVYTLPDISLSKHDILILSERTIIYYLSCTSSSSCCYAGDMNTKNGVR
jgi:hypothetical protein